jgi:hypothetical protein
MALEVLVVEGGADPEGVRDGIVVGNPVSVCWLVAEGGRVPDGNVGGDGKARLGSIPGRVCLGTFNPRASHAAVSSVCALAN